MDDEVLRQLAEINKGIGRLEGKVDGIDSHVKAVSGKADAVRGELVVHAKDPDAHPQAANRSSRNWRDWITLAIAAAAFLWPFFPKRGKG